MANSTSRPLPRKNRYDGLPRPEMLFFDNVTINGTVNCYFTLRTEERTFTIYSPAEVQDRQLKLDDILDIDTSGKGDNQLTLAFVPEAATTGIVLPPGKSADFVEEKIDPWIGHTPFDSLEEKVAAGHAPSPIPTLLSSKGLVVLKLRFEKAHDYTKFTENLALDNIFEMKTKRSIKTLFLAEKKSLVAPTWRKQDQEFYFKSGLLDGWKKEKY